MLNDRSLVAEVAEHSDESIIRLVNGTDPQVFLKKLVESGATVSKIEQVEPSLNDIFIEEVGKTDA